MKYTLLLCWMCPLVLVSCTDTSSVPFEEFVARKVSVRLNNVPALSNSEIFINFDYVINHNSTAIADSLSGEPSIVCGEYTTLPTYGNNLRHGFQRMNAIANRHSTSQITIDLKFNQSIREIVGSNYSGYSEIGCDEVYSMQIYDAPFTTDADQNLTVRLDSNMFKQFLTRSEYFLHFDSGLSWSRLFKASSIPQDANTDSSYIAITFYK